MRLHVLLFFALLTLTACKTANTVVATPVTFPPENVYATATLDLRTMASNTPTVSLDTMRYQCLSILNPPPPDYTLKGTIVYNKDDNTDAFLWNNDTRSVYRFPRQAEDRLMGFDVSLDRQHIAYLKTNSQGDQLVVATAEGQPIWSQVVNSSYWKWFDNERLIGLVVPENGMPSLFLLNPFADRRRDLHVEYPDSRTFSNDPTHHWQYSNGGLPVYDPTLTRVVYPECDSQCQDRLVRGESGWPIALLDTDTNRVLARITTMDRYGDTPLWTSDGRQLIIAMSIDPNERSFSAGEFFSISREGQTDQLTHFTDYYEEVDIPDSYSLSPNGKRIAFWIIARPSQYEGARLAVLNTETGEVINYCIQSDGFMRPIWSPDGSQLLVVVATQGAEHVVLVDVLRHYAAQIADAQDLKPVGWMVSP